MGTFCVLTSDLYSFMYLFSKRHCARQYSFNHKQNNVTLLKSLKCLGFIQGVSMVEVSKKTPGTNGLVREGFLEEVASVLSNISSNYNRFKSLTECLGAVITIISTGPCRQRIRAHRTLQHEGILLASPEVCTMNSWLN